jgi:hypothetical protein
MPFHISYWIYNKSGIYVSKVMFNIVNVMFILIDKAGKLKTIPLVIVFS